MPNYMELLVRLALACFLGGIIGIEREKSRHPAGLRTHILVCVGSALVMLCNIYIFEQYKGHANIDPGRFGAQVISGIGFLGAGTILKEGVTVKGLTTAASLWSVACIGISVGLGFYSGSVLTTAFVLITLVVFSRFEGRISGGKKNIILKIRSMDKPGQIGKIGTELGLFNLQICDISIELEDEASVMIKLRINKGREDISPELIDRLSKIEGILYVEVCE
ncbi:MAG: MgtC/SapB family protein [Clostridiaceae bacterium]|nr:MgtC/SapB family protein [Clostridiaceae bacterium]